MLKTPDDETLKKLKDLQRGGRYLDAWMLVKDLTPPEQWPTPISRMSGALLLERLGDWDRAVRMYFRDWRRKESRAIARAEMFWEVLDRRGAFLTWRWLQRYAPAPEESIERHGEHQAHLAVVLTRMRDFERAEECLKRGQELEPDSRWFEMLRADLLQEQDRREEALELTNQVVQAEPDYVFAIRTHADLLSELGQDEEAVSVLRRALTLVQAGELVVPLVNLLIEMDRHEEAWEALELYEKFMPLADADHRDWLNGRRCDIASHRGNPKEALHWAEKILNSGFYKKVVEKLRTANGELRRHILSVPFVQQHHSTCAPASVTSIALFWGREVGHLDLADEICYDGTPDYKERTWADTNGWATREFKVTLESAKLLLDQGMPFILNTVYPGGAHAQVVIGYDEFRSVLFIRDPGDRHTNEFLAAESLEEQAPFGPRGFVMIPETESARLAALTLPEADLYDLTHEINSSLDAHDRQRAMAALENLQTLHPNHLLRWHGELAMARYDGLQSQVLTGLEEILKQHPKVENWQTERISTIRDVHGRDAMIAALREICGAKDSHPIHWRMLARELHWDDRHAAEAMRLLLRVHRRRVDAIAILSEANVVWWEEQHEKAVEIYRLAACLDDKNEDLVMTYFRATKWVRQTDAALAMMRRRFELEGEHSGQPAITLYRALDQVQESSEGLAVLEESLKRRPDDADHALFVAGELVLWNRVARAREILEGIQKNARSAAWHRVQARLARHEGDGEAQMKHHRAVLEDQPLDSDAHRAVAYLLDKQVGEKAGYEFLQEACSRFPFHWQLHVALLDWAKDQGKEACEAVVHELLRIDPSDGWARRELAEVLRQQGRYAEAHAELDEADKSDAGNVAQHTMRASVLEDEDRFDEARHECRKALRMDIDNSFAMRCLVRLSRSHEQRLEALRFMQAELKRQTTQGDAVTEFAQVARATLEDEDLEQCLREGWQQRPDLWQTGVQLAEHLRHTDREEEAIEIMRGMTERFPLMPRVWMELGLSLEIQGDRAAAIEATMKVRELNPAWAWGMRTLSEMIRKTGDYPGAQAVLEEALRHNPDDAMHHGWLAEVLWHEGRRTEALDHLTTSVEKDPGYAWAWDMLARWGKAAGRADAAREAALKLQKERPGEARTWMIYAELLTEHHELDERLAVLDKAMMLSPDVWRPADMKARVLALAGRFEAALAICREHPSGALELRHREAWILHRTGKYDEAVKVMDAALEEDPDYPWPWQLLAEWHQSNDKLELAEKACRQLAKVQPTEPQPLGFLGSLLETQKKRAEAKEALREALEVSPDYHFAFQRLFWMHLEDAEWAEVEQVLEAGTLHYPSINLQSRRFVFHARRRHWEPAKAALKAILDDLDDDTDAFTRVHKEMEKIPGTALTDLRQVIEAALSQPECNVNTGRLYVDVCKLGNRLPSPAVMKLIPTDTESGERAYAGYIYWIGERWKKSRKGMETLWGLREQWRWNCLMKEHQAWFRRNPELYGAVTYTLHSARKRQATIEWLHDWRERQEQMEPYILNNLILALQETGQAEESRRVIAHGMTLANHNSTKMRFHIWAAMDALLDERLDVLSLMDPVLPASLDSYGKDLLDMLQLINAYFRDDPPAFASIKPRLKKFLNAHQNNPVMRTLVLRTCRLIGQRLGSGYPVWWLRMERVKRWLPDVS